MSIEAMRFARDWIAEKPALRPCSAGKVVSMLTTAIAAAEKAAPVAWSPRYSYFGYETQRAWCNGVPRPQDVAYYSRLAGGIDYAYATPPDTAAMLAEKDALLRQALEAFSAFRGAFDTPISRRRASDEFSDDARRRMRELDEAIRNNLGVKND